MHTQRTSLLLLALACFPSGQPVLASDDLLTIEPGLTKRMGKDAESGIAYSRILLQGQLVAPAGSADAPALVAASTAPTLTAQCTRRQNGTSTFEVFVNYGGVDDTSFHPPWRPRSSADLFPPTTQKTNITFNFFGYTKVKPITRQWESVLEVPGQWRYNNPSGSSRNMEPVAFYLQYLRALPTLRLTHADVAAQFKVGPWMEAVRKDPLCKASGL